MAREYLAPLARILCACGHSPRRMQREFAAVCATLKEPRAGRIDPLGADAADLPHVLAHWHTDPDLLTERGRPRALPLQGRRSLAALIRRVYPHAPIETIRRALERNGAIVREGGRFRPSARAVAFAPADGAAHGLAAVRGLLRTLEHNLAEPRRPKRLFERFALNPNVPVRLQPGFEAYLRPQAGKFLFALDGKLSRLEGRRQPGERLARIGVGVYCFEEPARRAPGRRGQRRAGRRKPRRSR